MTTVGSGLRVATRTVSKRTMLDRIDSRIDLPKTRNQCKVEVEDILQPLYGSSGLVCEDFDEIRASLITGGFQCVIVELLDTVSDIEVDLGASESTVDTGRGLC